MKKSIGYLSAMFVSPVMAQATAPFTDFNSSPVSNSPGLHLSGSWPAAGGVLAFGGLFVFCALLGSALSAFWIWMLIDAIERPLKDKTVWILVIVLGSFVGAIIYYFAARKEAIAHPAAIAQPFSAPQYAPSAQSAPAVSGIPAAPMASAADVKPMSGGAIASLILGIASDFIPFLGFILAIVAIVLGFKAHGKAKKGLVRGEGMAIAGIVTGFVGIVFFLFTILPFVFFFLAFLSVR